MHAVSGKLNDSARQFQAGESTGFGIRLGVKYRDPKTKEDAWTNYNAVIFAKSPGQISFYQSTLIAGAIVTVTAEQLKIDSFQGNNGEILTIDMLNARISYVYSPNQGQPQASTMDQAFGGQRQAQQQPVQQQAPQQMQQQQPVQQPVQQQMQQQQPQYQQQVQPQYAQQQQQPVQQAPNNGSFDDDIPF